MGKTGLIHHCFAQEELQEHYYLFIVDIYATKSLAELTYSLGRTILSALKSKERKAWERFIQIVGSLRTGITLDALGQPSWNLEIGDILSPKVSLDEIFRYLNSASAVQRSLSALQEKDIITSNNGQYFIYDYFLNYWLKHQ